MKPFGIVYLATNIINNKCYVGITTKTLKIRMKTHIKNSKIYGDNNLFYNAIRKYNENNFKWNELYVCFSREELNLMEKQMIKKYKSHYSENGYNSTYGGDGISGYKFSEKSKEKMKNAWKFREPMSEETKRKIRMVVKGRKLHPHSEETKRKISMATKGKLLGRKHTEETKRKIGEKSKGRNIGRKHSDEEREKISLSQIGKKRKPFSIEHRKKLSDAAVKQHLMNDI